VRALLDQLDTIDFKANCPHGRPVVFEISLAELERRVDRR
jgi:DNA mismatch repair protein MutL